MLSTWSKYHPTKREKVNRGVVGLQRVFECLAICFQHGLAARLDNRDSSNGWRCFLQAICVLHGQDAILTLTLTLTLTTLETPRPERVLQGDSDNPKESSYLFKDNNNIVPPQTKLTPKYRFDFLLSQCFHFFERFLGSP